jgi:hypothetical protein
VPHKGVQFAITPSSANLFTSSGWTKALWQIAWRLSPLPIRRCTDAIASSTTRAEPSASM